MNINRIWNNTRQNCWWDWKNEVGGGKATVTWCSTTASVSPSSPLHRFVPCHSKALINSETLLLNLIIFQNQSQLCSLLLVCGVSIIEASDPWEKSCVPALNLFPAALPRYKPTSAHWLFRRLFLKVAWLIPNNPLHGWDTIHVNDLYTSVTSIYDISQQSVSSPVHSHGPTVLWLAQSHCCHSPLPHGSVPLA